MFQRKQTRWASWAKSSAAPSRLRRRGLLLLPLCLDRFSTADANVYSQVGIVGERADYSTCGVALCTKADSCNFPISVEACGAYCDSLQGCVGFNYNSELTKSNGGCYFVGVGCPRESGTSTIQLWMQSEGTHSTQCGELQSSHECRGEELLTTSSSVVLGSKDVATRAAACMEWCNSQVIEGAICCGLVKNTKCALRNGALKSGGGNNRWASECSLVERGTESPTAEPTPSPSTGEPTNVPISEPTEQPTNVESTSEPTPDRDPELTRSPTMEPTSASGRYTSQEMRADYGSCSIGIDLEGVSVSDCEARCDDEADVCWGFNYNENTRSCYLVSRCDDHMAVAPQGITLYINPNADLPTDFPTTDFPTTGIDEGCAAYNDDCGLCVQEGCGMLLDGACVESCDSYEGSEACFSGFSPDDICTERIELRDDILYCESFDSCSMCKNGRRENGERCLWFGTCVATCYEDGCAGAEESCQSSGPTESPTLRPTQYPTAFPSDSPTEAVDEQLEPTQFPTRRLTNRPTVSPTLPTPFPTDFSTRSPTEFPTYKVTSHVC